MHKLKTVPDKPPKSEPAEDPVHALVRTLVEELEDKLRHAVSNFELRKTKAELDKFSG